MFFKVSIAASQIRNYCLENQKHDPLLNNHRDGNPFDDGKRTCIILWKVNLINIFIKFISPSKYKLKIIPDERASEEIGPPCWFSKVWSVTAFQTVYFFRTSSIRRYDRPLSPPLKSIMIADRLLYRSV